VGKFTADPIGEKPSQLPQWEIRNLHNNVIAFVTTA